MACISALTFEDLPNEVLLLFVEALKDDWCTLAALSRTCHRMHRLVGDSLYRVVGLKRREGEHDKLTRQIWLLLRALRVKPSRADRLTELHMHAQTCGSEARLVRALLFHSRHVHYSEAAGEVALNTTRAWCPDDYYEIPGGLVILEPLRNITVLTINWPGVDVTDLFRALLFPQLRSLTLGHFKGYRLPVRSSKNPLPVSSRPLELVFLGSSIVNVELLEEIFAWRPNVITLALTIGVVRGAIQPPATSISPAELVQVLQATINTLEVLEVKQPSVSQTTSGGTCINLRPFSRLKHVELPSGCPFDETAHSLALDGMTNRLPRSLRNLCICFPDGSSPLSLPASGRYWLDDYNLYDWTMGMLKFKPYLIPELAGFSIFQDTRQSVRNADRGMYKSRMAMPQFLATAAQEARVNVNIYRLRPRPRVRLPPNARA